MKFSKSNQKLHILTVWWAVVISAEVTFRGSFSLKMKFISSEVSECGILSHFDSKRERWEHYSNLICLKLDPSSAGKLHAFHAWLCKTGRRNIFLTRGCMFISVAQRQGEAIQRSVRRVNKVRRNWNYSIKYNERADKVIENPLNTTNKVV